jgi:iron complex outermembrane receptor protein
MGFFLRVGQLVGRRACIVAAATGLLVPATSFAQQPDPTWLQSIDELMDVETTSAAKREKRLGDTAAAAFVLSRDDIRRSGADSVPGLLRLVPGVHVAQIDGNKWAVTVRGFNSRWANKLLVMIDGQSVYADLFSGVYWDALDVPIDLIERIEVIRGPGGSLWGANAVNGVINIITRTAGTRGGAASATLGSFGHSTASLRYAGAVGGRVRYHSYFGAGDQDAIVPDITVDKWRSVRFGGGVVADVSTRDSLELQAAGHRGGSWATSPRVESSAPLRHVYEPTETSTDSHRASLKWSRALRRGGVVQTAASWMATSRDDRVLSATNEVFEFSFQHAAGRKGRHELTWGAAFRQSDIAATGSPTYDLNPGASRQSQTGAFVQDDLRFAADRVVITLGSKVERFTQTGWHWQPTARALWNLTPRQSVWTAASRAVRTPSLTERGMVVNLFETTGRTLMIAQLFGNPHLREESLKAFEAGYRWTASAVSVDLAAYHNRYDDAVNLEVGAPYFVTSPGVPHLVLPVMFDNKMLVSTAGGEALLTVSASPRWRIVGSYGLFTVSSRLQPDSRNFATAAFDASSPRHQGSVRSLFALPAGLDLDTTVFLVGAIHSEDVPAYARVDTRIGWRVRRAIDVSVLARNLLGNAHREFAGTSAGTTATELRRKVSVMTTWRF